MQHVSNLKNIVYDQDYFFKTLFRVVVHFDILMVPEEAIFFTSFSEKPYDLIVLFTP